MSQQRPERVKIGVRQRWKSLDIQRHSLARRQARSLVASPSTVGPFGNPPLVSLLASVNRWSSFCPKWHSTATSLSTRPLSTTIRLLLDPTLQQPALVWVRMLRWRVFPHSKRSLLTPKIACISITASSSKSNHFPTHSRNTISYCNFDKATDLIKIVPMNSTALLSPKRDARKLVRPAAKVQCFN
jgi:hypothetical protein